jgi:hypothetical protein
VEELSANKRLVDCCLVVLSPNLFGLQARLQTLLI